MTGKGVETFWSTIRRNNRVYIPTKIFSVMVAAALAGYTLSFKQDVQAYAAQVGTKGTDHYTIIYWMLFIFYSFQALDELIELFSVMAQREKGALGLLFEMNYFLGFGLMIYIMYMTYSNSMHELAEQNEKASKLWEFLQYQTYVFYAACGGMVACTGLMVTLNSRLQRGRKSSKTVDN